jgi:hypothetical protein
MLAKLHLAKDTFALQLFLQRSQGLVDVVISNKYLHAGFPFFNLAIQASSGRCSAGIPMRLSTMTTGIQRQGDFRRPFGDQFISPIFRHKSSATWPSDLKPGKRSLILVDFVLLGVDRRGGCTL